MALAGTSPSHMTLSRSTPCSEHTRLLGCNRTVPPSPPPPSLHSLVCRRQTFPAYHLRPAAQSVTGASTLRCLEPCCIAANKPPLHVHKPARPRTRQRLRRERSALGPDRPTGSFHCMRYRHCRQRLRSHAHQAWGGIGVALGQGILTRPFISGGWTWTGFDYKVWRVTCDV